MKFANIWLMVVAMPPSFILTLHRKSAQGRSPRDLEVKLQNASSFSSLSSGTPRILDPRTAVLMDANGSSLPNADEALTRRLKPPAAPETPYNLDYPEKTYYSQMGQDQFVDKILNHLQNGFYIEVGAYNGEDHSNTLFLERTRGWQGLLMQPNPYLFRTLVSKQRKAHTLEAGISPTGQPSSFPFKLAGPLGGISENYTAEHENRADTEIAEGQPWMHGEEGSGRVIQVPCFPLEMVLHRVGNPTVDYFSLDVEGAELRILQNLNFQKIKMGVISIEHNGNHERRTAINDILLQNGFAKVQDDNQDFIYASKAYFTAKGLPLALLTAKHDEHREGTRDVASKTKSFMAV